ncbi:glycosyltransferase [Rhodospira trueperi]|uniref:Putative cofactor-binding repeat-containing protein n=1 Tax=Rhodospira trueperi TaxID=69960 RepID=A0A1G7FQJ6_9PROT|nr:glycosyltransferase [Rhodospira trueperi]SDE78211.1 putative cofactor-binding repeat-containing protein [Rhodospira trueperi]
MPSISVVVPVLNRATMIADALDSVADQADAVLECLVVDGGSTDGTREVVSAHPVARLIDAPGTSIYQALNRAIQAASGELIVHLNSDDRLAPGALTAIGAAADPDVDIVRGVARYVRFDTNGLEQKAPILDDMFLPTLTMRNVLFGAPAINANAVRKTTYERIGLYDERLRIAADREWLLRAVLAEVKIRSISETVYIYRAHAGSLTIHDRSPAEVELVREHLDLAARWLAAPTVDHISRKRLLCFHAKEVVHRLVLQVSGRESGTLGQTVRHAFAVSPLWPIAAIGPLSRIAADRIARVLRRHEHRTAET